MKSRRALALFGCWVMCGVSVAACSASESPESAAAPPPYVPPANADMPAVQAPASPDMTSVEAANPGASAGNESTGVEPAAQPPASEGVGNDVPIDPDTNMVDSTNGDGTSSGETPSEPPGDGNTEEPTPSDPKPTNPTPTDPAPLAPITIWIAGDSTVANGNTPCPRGWGGAFAPHFNDLVTVTNSAVGGRSVHTWLYEVQTVFDDATGECALNRDANGEPVLQPRWQAMLDGMKAGDYLFIQFGINDGSPTCDRHVGIDAFTTAYGMMAEAAKARGAHPIFLTPVSMIACTGNTARGSRGGFVPATIEAGVDFDVPVIDLHQRSVDFFQSRGFCPIPGGDVSATTTGPVGDFFCDDHTHFSSAGAVEIADVVVRALVEQQIPLAAYLRP